ncbi:MAG: imidazole glycerol phosphate synthase subunit HisH [Clostridiales bacterium]|nr:imidazole glycerol phosphate synthase subunit HisH [Clostridiales bacterium]
MVAIVDYGAGNLQSVKKALDYIGAENVVTQSAAQIRQARHVILPGVGAFGDAMKCMGRAGLVETVRRRAESGAPFLGICLGLQLLFEGSEESPGAEGLGVLRGTIRKLPAAPGLKVPHMGWNSIALSQRDGVFSGIAQDSYFYFVHSYYVDTADKSQSAATARYGLEFDCAVQDGCLAATQFHPEKSAGAGLQLLRNFVNQ